MKQILILILCLNVYSVINAQCDYRNESDAPEELYRKRVKESGMRYGNPYTMFVKGDDFNLISTLKKIRDNIRQGQPFDPSSNTNDYTQLYKEIWEYWQSKNNSYI